MKRFKKLLASILILAMALTVVGTLPAPAQAATPVVTLNEHPVTPRRVINRVMMVEARSLGSALRLQADADSVVGPGQDSMRIRHGSRELFLVAGSRQAFLTTEIGRRAEIGRPAPVITNVTLAAAPRVVGRGAGVRLFVPFNDVIRQLDGSFSRANVATLTRAIPVRAFDFTLAGNRRDIFRGTLFADVYNTPMVGRGASFPDRLFGRRDLPRHTAPDVANAWFTLFRDASVSLSAHPARALTTGEIRPFGYNSSNIDGSVLTDVYGAVSGFGSGAGIDAVRARMAHFGGTDLIGLVSAADKEDYALLPVATGGVAVIYNLPGIVGLRLTPEIIAQIYLGVISRWNDGRITALNPGVTLPNANIIVNYRPEASGTTEIFTTYLAAAAGRVWNNTTATGLLPAGVSSDTSRMAEVTRALIPVGRRQPEFAVGVGVGGSALRARVFGAAESVITPAVSPARYSIGYMSRGDLRDPAQIAAVARVRNRAGNFVLPDVGNVFAASIGHADHLRHPVNAAGAGAYPITGFTWIMVERDASRAKPNFDAIGTAAVVPRPPSTPRLALAGAALISWQQSTEVVKDFVRWAVVEGFGDAWAQEIQLAPLAPHLRQLVNNELDTIRGIR